MTEMDRKEKSEEIGELETSERKAEIKSWNFIEKDIQRGPQPP